MIDGRYLELGGIITALEAEDPQRVLPLGFHNPHSYRGFYDQLAFEPAANITIGDMLAAARTAVGATYQGWKGGDYTMSESTDCWIAVEGTDSDNKIGPMLLGLMLTQASPDRQTEAEVPEEPADGEAVRFETNGYVSAAHRDDRAAKAWDEDEDAMENRWWLGGKTRPWTWEELNERGTVTRLVPTTGPLLAVVEAAQGWRARIRDDNPVGNWGDDEDQVLVETVDALAAFDAVNHG